MDIHHIRYFLAVCETMNFTLAAQKCNVAQPALSRAVQQLEEEVGGLLIRREKGGNHLTDLGLLMKPRFQNIIAQLGDVKLQARRFLTLEKANINLGIMCTVGPTRFAGLLVNFAVKQPDITLQIFEGVPSSLKAKLENGDIDLALMASPEELGEEFDSEVLYKERFVMAFAMGHRYARMNAVPMREINGEVYLRRLNCEYYDQLTSIAHSMSARTHMGYASEREDWIQNLVAGGLGICIIPEFSAAIAGLQTRPLIEPEVWRDVCLVTRRGRQQPAAVRSLLDSLRGYPFPGSRFSSNAA